MKRRGQGAPGACDPDTMAKSAVEHFMAAKRTCGEAILLAGLEALGLEIQGATDFAMGFGGGIGLQGKVCGVVAGATMVLGLAVGTFEKDDNKKKAAAFKAVEQFCKAFEKEYGCTDCRTLSGLDLTTEEGRKKLGKSVKADRCSKLVAFGAEALAKSLQDLAAEYA